MSSQGTGDRTREFADSSLLSPASWPSRFLRACGLLLIAVLLWIVDLIDELVTPLTTPDDTFPRIYRPD